MVEERFSEAQLPEEFVEQIKTLLDLAIDKAQRQAAIKRLQALGTDAVEPLVRALADERRWVRHAAVLALCAISDAHALQPVLDLLLAGRWYAQEEDGFIDLPTMGLVLRIPGMRQRLIQLVRDNRAPKDELAEPP